jgi:cytochrome d ubiquinol oxidase subunit I
MVSSGFFMLFIAFVYWLFFFLRRRKAPEHKLLLWGIVVSGVLGFLAVELGWMVTELGRQPWTIYGFLRTRDAATTAPWLNESFLAFTGIYILLGVALVWLLLRVARTPMPRLVPQKQAQKAGM